MYNIFICRYFTLYSLLYASFRLYVVVCSICEIRPINLLCWIEIRGIETKEKIRKQVNDKHNFLRKLHFSKEQSESISFDVACNFLLVHQCIFCLTTQLFHFQSSLCDVCMVPVPIRLFGSLWCSHKYLSIPCIMFYVVLSVPAKQ